MAIQISSQVSDRLAIEQNIWLTTTSADGMPLPNVVWFVWRNGEFLVFTPLGSIKMKNMRRNPRVSLCLNSLSVDGSDVAIFQGEADVSAAPATDDEFTAYTTKYEEGLKLLGFTDEALREAYVPLRIKVTKFRTVTG